MTEARLMELAAMQHGEVSECVGEIKRLQAWLTEERELTDRVLDRAIREWKETPEAVEALTGVQNALEANR